VRPSAAGRAIAAAAAVATGRPAQVGWMMPRRVWRTVRRAARDADVALAMTARSVRSGLPVPIVIDHVDALSLSMRRRARGAAPHERLAALLESVLLSRWERRLARLATASLVTSAEDAAALPAAARPTVLPVSIPPHPRAAEDDQVPEAAARPIDLVLTGNMGYPPNADAAAWLSTEIAPRIWARRPETTIAVAGRNADRLDLDERIAVHADVPDLRAFLRGAELAAAPLRLGTGTPYKVLEALAAGAVLIATPEAVRPFGLGDDVAATASTAQALADHAVALLDDPARRAAMRHAARRALLPFTPQRQNVFLTAVLKTAASTPDPVRSHVPVPA
jgi:hypothetical protein